MLLYMLPEANAVLAREVLEPQLPAGCGARVVRRLTATTTAGIWAVAILRL